MKIKNHKKTFPVNWTTLAKIHPPPLITELTFNLAKWSTAKYLYKRKQHLVLLSAYGHGRYNTFKRTDSRTFPSPFVPSAPVHLSLSSLLLLLLPHLQRLWLSKKKEEGGTESWVVDNLLLAGRLIGKST